jgi:hypothetical protein
MAQSKCGFCNNTSFELKETTPLNSNFKMYFIQCNSCGHPVGTVDYRNTNVILDEVKQNLQSDIEGVSGQVNSLSFEISRILRILNN